MSEHQIERRESKRHVSFDFVPTAIDYQQSSPVILTFQRKPSRIDILTTEQLYYEALRLKIISLKSGIQVDKPKKKKHNRVPNRHTSVDLSQQQMEPSRRNSFSIDDFDCMYSEEELRSLVSKAWCEHMLKRMNSVGIEISMDLYPVHKIEEMYTVYKSL